jgi:hypothetical protein
MVSWRHFSAIGFVKPLDLLSPIFETVLAVAGHGGVPKKILGRFAKGNLPIFRLVLCLNFRIWFNPSDAIIESIARSDSAELVFDETIDPG